MKNIQISAIATILLVACNGGGNDHIVPVPGQSTVLSSGLKIFVTSETHAGDFASDPTLAGSDAIEKADDFCNQSLTKPNNSTYKALIVDGVNRDAISLTNWVLQPSTTYFLRKVSILRKRCQMVRH